MDRTKKMAQDSQPKTSIRHLHTDESFRSEEAIVINRDWFYNQDCRLSHQIHVISHVFITLAYIFEMITKCRLSNNSFDLFIN